MVKLCRNQRHHFILKYKTQDYVSTSSWPRNHRQVVCFAIVCMSFYVCQILLLMHGFQMVEKVVPAPQRLPAHGARDKVQQVVPCLFFPCVENTTTNAPLKIVSEACWEATIAVLTLWRHDGYWSVWNWIVTFLYFNDITWGQKKSRYSKVGILQYKTNAILHQSLFFITVRLSRNWSGKDNLSNPITTTHFLVRLLKSSSNWTKVSMTGPQSFSGWY